MGLSESLHIKKITPKPLRLSIALFFVTAVLIGVATPLRGNSQPPVTFERFSEQMLKHHDVDHVISYRAGGLLNVDVYLKKESLNKPEYADAGKESSAQYTFTASTYDGLVKAINEAETRYGYVEGDKIPVSIEAGRESLLSNWLVQCVIMFILLITPIICGYFGHGVGKKRTMGPTAGFLLGVFLGPFGLIIVYASQKKPSQKNGGMRV